MIEVGTILQNRYRIEKQIGQGGMGKVYVASDERFNSTVAIKETVFEDKNLRRAFEREARLLNSLKHQALPRVSDHFTEEDGQFLVMEYIAGEDLAEIMEREGNAFPLQKVLNWSYQLCDALDYLHAQDIIHRDIKPQNLKLTPNGHIVLLDFGLAKGNPSDSKNLTAAKSIFGYSRNYASLEQIQGTGTEPRSDLYSLSATIYHLLTGIPPADALTRAMNVLNKQPDPLIPANYINKEIPAGVAEILQKTMALDASERPVSAVEMRRMLEDCDKTVDPNAVVPAPPKSLTADFLTQETKIKPLATAAVADQSFVETKLTSPNDSAPRNYETTIDSGNSAVTNVRPFASPTEAPKFSRKTIAGGIAGLILAGSAFSAVYFFSARHRTETNGGNSRTQFQANTGNQAVDNKSIQNSDTTNITVVSTNANTETTDTTVTSKSTQPDRPATRAAKTESSRKSGNQSGNSNKPVQNREIKEDEMIVNGSRVETRDMIIDETGIRMKYPAGRRAPRVPPSPENFPGFSPEQLEKLKELQKKRVYVIKTPNPKPAAPVPTP